MDSKQIDVMVADASHEVYVDKILDTIREAAKVRGTGIAERTHEYVATKMKEGKAIIALCGDDFAGFTYIESWGNKQYVATSGLIVHPKYGDWGWQNVSRPLLSAWHAYAGLMLKFSVSPAELPS